MMQAVAESLQAHGVAKTSIKVELFAASIPKHQRKPQARRRRAHGMHC